MQYSLFSRFLLPLTTLAGCLSLVPAAAQSPIVTRASLSPAANARSAPRTSDVVIPFSQTINPVTAGNVRVHSRQRGGQLVRSGSATVSTSGSTITVDPTTDFKPGETVYVTVPTSVTSTGGVAATKYVHQFTAGVTPSFGTFAGEATSASAIRRWASPWATWTATATSISSRPFTVAIP